MAVSPPRAVLVCAFTLCLGFADTPGELSGLVSDPGGRPLAGATVSATGDVRKTVTVLTDAGGAFAFPALPAGRYRVEASLPGFQPTIRDSVLLGDGAALALRLMPGDPMAGAASAAYLNALTDGEEKRRFILDCTGCHQFSAVTVRMGDRLKTESEWEDRIDQMLQFAGPYSNFPIISTYREADRTAAWLTRELGQGTPRFSPLDPRRPTPADGRVVITSYPFPKGQDLPHDVKVDAAGQVLVTGMFSHAMQRLDPATGEFTEVPIPVPAANPRAVDLDDRGRWLVLLGNPRKIARYDPVVATWSMFDIPVYPHSIVWDPAGAVWYNGHFTQNPTVYQRLDLDTGEQRRYPVPAPLGFDGSPIPYEIRRGPDGTIWGSELAGNRLVRIDPVSGVVKAYELPTSHSGPRRLDVDTAGIVWVPEYAAGKLARFDPATEQFTEFPLPTRDALPYVVRIDRRRGTIWLAEAGADQLARFDPATGTFEEFPLPDRSTLVRHIDIDERTGAVWAAYGHSPARSPKIVRLELRE